MSGEHSLVMLQVGVHDRQVTRLAREHPLEAGAGETAAADSGESAQRDCRLRRSARDRRGLVRRIIVDEYHLPIVAGENAAEPRDQDRNVGFFVEGRHDDREFRRARVPPLSGAEARPLGSRRRSRLSSAMTKSPRSMPPHCCSVRRRRLPALAKPWKTIGNCLALFGWPAGLCFGEIRCPQPGAIHLNEINQDPLHSRSALSSPDGAWSCENHEGVIVAGALGCFAALWMLYDTITLAPVDLRWDASEASAVGAAFCLRLRAPADDGVAVCAAVRGLSPRRLGGAPAAT